MTYTFNPPTGEIIDDDGQVIATLSDNALPEQGEALVRAYNNDGEAMRKCACLCVSDMQTNYTSMSTASPPPAKVAEAIANTIKGLT